MSIACIKIIKHYLEFSYIVQVLSLFVIITVCLTRHLFSRASTDEALTLAYRVDARACYFADIA